MKPFESLQVVRKVVSMIFQPLFPCPKRIWPDSFNVTLMIKYTIQAGVPASCQGPFYAMIGLKWKVP